MLRSIVAGFGFAALLGASEAGTPPTPTPTPTPAPTPPAAPAPSVAGLGQIRGTVSYGRRDPAVGAIVIARPEGAPSPVHLATTGTSGTFAFDGLTDGTYRVEVRRDGSAPIIKSGVKVRAPFRAVVEVVLVPGEAPRGDAAPVDGSASFSGIVRIAGGAPLPEARVRLTRDDGADESKTVFTNASGDFSIPELKAGRWRVEVQGAGLLPVRAQLDLLGDVAFDVQLAAQPVNYRPLPQDLIVPEDVIPPPGV